MNCSDINNTIRELFVTDQHLIECILNLYQIQNK